VSRHCGINGQGPVYAAKGLDTIEQHPWKPGGFIDP